MAKITRCQPTSVRTRTRTGATGLGDWISYSPVWDMPSGWETSGDSPTSVTRMEEVRGMLLSETRLPLNEFEKPL